MAYFIIGYPCCGKTTFGKKIAKQKHMNFVDVDEFIVERTGLSISDIFDKYGETRFRRYEREMLEYIVELFGPNTIISCGGGLPCYEDNMNYMSKHGIVAWMDIPLDVILKRIKKKDEIDKRPLMKEHYDKGDLEEFVKSGYETRKNYYQKADIVIKDDEKDFDFEWAKSESLR